MELAHHLRSTNSIWHSADSSLGEIQRYARYREKYNNKITTNVHQHVAVLYLTKILLKPLFTNPLCLVSLQRNTIQIHGGQTA